MFSPVTTGALQGYSMGCIMTVQEQGANVICDQVCVVSSLSPLENDIDGAIKACILFAVICHKSRQAVAALRLCLGPYQYTYILVLGAAKNLIVTWLLWPNNENA